jgi:DNA-binding NarL/FixJ family response regulator
MIEVLLADDQPLVRAGLRVLFEGEPDIAVTGEAANGEEVLRLARDRRPDVVLMDIRMPVLDGLEATRQIAADERLAAVKVLILTTFESDQYVFEALRAGAGGFLLKDAEPTELLHAVRVLDGGDSLLAPSVTRRLIAEFLAGPESRHASLERLEGLTEREREIMALVAEGLSNGQIAERLTISPATVKTHVSRAMLKLGARDRAQLVVLAYQTGLVVAGRPS